LRKRASLGWALQVAATVCHGSNPENVGFNASVAKTLRVA
jgi:hypothetical protein